MKLRATDQTHSESVYKIPRLLKLHYFSCFANILQNTHAQLLTEDDLHFQIIVQAHNYFTDSFPKTISIFSFNYQTLKFDTLSIKPGNSRPQALLPSEIRAPVHGGEWQVKKYKSKKYLTWWWGFC